MRDKENIVEHAEGVDLSLLSDLKASNSDVIAVYASMNKNLVDNRERAEKLLFKNHNISHWIRSCRCHLQSRDLVESAVQLLTYLLGRTDIKSEINKQQAAEIMKDIIKTLEGCNNANVLTKTLSLLCKQKIDEKSVESMLPAVLQVLKKSLAKSELFTSNVKIEYLNFIGYCLETFPKRVCMHYPDWIPIIVQLCMDLNSDNRTRAVEVLEEVCNLRKSTPELATDIGALLKNDIKGSIAPFLKQQLARKEHASALKLWSLLITLLGKSIHVGSSVLNSLLAVVEPCFKNSEYSVRLVTFKAWKVLVQNFATNLDVLTNTARLKLLVQPLVHLNVATKELALAKLDTWLTLCVGLQHKLEDNAVLVLLPLLRFMMGGTMIEIDFAEFCKNEVDLYSSFDKEVVSRDPKLYYFKLESSPKLITNKLQPVIPHIQKRVGKVLQSILGLNMTLVKDCPLEPHCALEKCESLISVGHVIIQCLRIWSSMEFVKGEDEYDISEMGTVVSECWGAIATKCKNLASKLEPPKRLIFVESLLLQFHAFLQQIIPVRPNVALNSCDQLLKGLVGEFESMTFTKQEINDISPAAFLLNEIIAIEVTQENEDVFSSVMCHLLESVFLTPIGRTLDCVEGFVTIVGDSCHKWPSASVVEVWANMHMHMISFIDTSCNVDQGSPTEHNFVCAYECLGFPIVFCAEDKNTDIKKVASEWASLFKQVSGSISLVNTADENTCAAEFCSIIVKNPRFSLKNPTTLYLMCEALEAMSGSLNFKEARNQVEERMNNKRSPLKWCESDGIQPLGSVTSYVNLVKLCWQRCLDKDTTATQNLMPRLGTVLVCAARLFEKVDWSSGQITLAHIFSVVLAETVKDASHAQSKNKWNAKGLLGWLDACYSSMTRGLIKSYGGPYDDICLDKLAPILCQGLSTSRSAIKSETISLWRTTFGLSTQQLNYSPEIKEVLLKVKSKLSILCPGLDEPPAVPASNLSLNETPTDERTVMLLSPTNDDISFHLDEPNSPDQNGGAMFVLHEGDDEESGDDLGGQKPAEKGGTGPQKRKREEEEGESSCVFVQPTEKKLMRLTEHQKEKLGEKGDVMFMEGMESQDGTKPLPPPDFILDTQDGSSLMGGEKEKETESGIEKDGAAPPTVPLTEENGECEIMENATTDEEDQSEVREENRTPKRGRKSRTPKKTKFRDSEGNSLNKSPSRSVSTTSGLESPKSATQESPAPQNMKVTIENGDKNTNDDVIFFDDATEGLDYLSMHNEKDGKENPAWTNEEKLRNEPNFDIEPKEEPLTPKSIEQPEKTQETVDHIPTVDAHQNDNTPTEAESPPKSKAPQSTEMSGLDGFDTVGGSPGGILKRRIESYTPPGSQSKKPRHVRFLERTAEGYLSDTTPNKRLNIEKSTPQRKSADDSSSPQIRRHKMSPAFANNFQRRTLMMVKQASGSPIIEEEKISENLVEKPDETPKENEGMSEKEEAIKQANDEPINKDMIGCKRPIKELIPLLSIAFNRQSGLLNVLIAKQILTIGDLASRTEVDIMQLPLRTPKLGTVLEALGFIQRKIIEETAAQEPVEPEISEAIAPEAVVEPEIEVVPEIVEKPVPEIVEKPVPELVKVPEVKTGEQPELVAETQSETVSVPVSEPQFVAEPAPEIEIEAQVEKSVEPEIEPEIEMDADFEGEEIDEIQKDPEIGSEDWPEIAMDGSNESGEGSILVENNERNIVVDDKMAGFMDAIDTLEICLQVNKSDYSCKQMAIAVEKLAAMQSKCAKLLVEKMQRNNVV